MRISYDTFHNLYYMWRLQCTTIKFVHDTQMPPKPYVAGLPVSLYK